MAKTTKRSVKRAVAAAAKRSAKLRGPRNSTEKKEYAFNTAAATAAVDLNVKDNIANHARALGTWKRYVTLCAEHKMSPTPAQCNRLLTLYNQRLKKARAEVGDTRGIADVHKSRVSEAVSILRMWEWKCWPQVFTMLQTLDDTSARGGVSAGTLLAASKWLRGTGENAAKWPKDKAEAPPRDGLFTFIDARRSQQNSGGNGKGGGHRIKAARSVKVGIDGMKRTARSMLMWFGKDERTKALDNYFERITLAVAEIESIARDVMKDRKAAE